jgi:dTDP-4-amino-4,6-dideoxygalactose transaminase
MDRLAFIPDVSASKTEVPFLDLSTVNHPVRATVVAGLERLFDTSAFINGPDVEQFEHAFAAYVGTDHCVGVASGLDALRLALLAIGVRPGDEVIVPASTFVATFEAVTQAGARPVAVDVCEEDLCIDVAATADAITPRTRAILPVHLYGQVADLRVLRELALDRDVEIVEDAAQAHGASRDGLRAGCGGRAAAFSFYPAKNLGALGDAGAVTTNDAELAARVRALREHGQQTKYESVVEGYTARLDTLQAIALAAKLPALDEGNARRRELAAGYRAALEGVGDLRLPAVPSGSDPVWHLYVVRTAEPKALAAALATANIATGRHYPIPPHLSGAYASLGHSEGDFPVTEALSRECLSLPIFPGMTDEQLDHVCATVREHFRG